MCSYAGKLISIEVALFLLLVVDPVRSEPFDIIAPDIIRMETSNAIGFGAPLLWVVGTSAVIPLAQLQTASINVSVDNLALGVSASVINEELAAPVLPGEVVGLTSANSQWDNSTMSGLLVSPETMKSVPLIGLSITHPLGYTGTGTISGNLTIGAETRRFRIALELGSFGTSPQVLVDSAQRIRESSQSVFQTGVGDIPVPVHDPFLGILQHVQLDITLNAGTLNVGDGQHSHNHATSFFQEITSNDGAHSHPGFGFGGFGNGITVSFSPATISAAPGHQHLVFALGTVTSNEGGHFHDYGSVSNSFVYAIGELAPFLGNSDFSIPTDDSFGFIPSHLHCFGFLCGVPTSPHEHVHTSNANWSTLTTFTFSPYLIPGLSPEGMVALAAMLTIWALAKARFNAVFHFGSGDGSSTG